MGEAAATVRVHVTTREGDDRVIEAPVGRSLMQVIRDGGVDELAAICGGACSCATCHVHVEPAFGELLPEMSTVEGELLDASDQRRQGSRLSCQINVEPRLAGLRVTVAPED